MQLHSRNGSRPVSSALFRAMAKDYMTLRRGTCWHVWRGFFNTRNFPCKSWSPLASKHPTPPANEARNGTASTFIALFAHVRQIKRFNHFCQPSHIRSSNIFAKIPSHELIAITVVPEINVDVGLPFVPVFPAQATEKVHIVNGGSQIINSLNYQHCRI